MFFSPALMLVVKLPIETDNESGVLLITVKVWSGFTIAQRGSGVSMLMVTETTVPSKLAHIPAAGCWAYGVARAYDFEVAPNMGVASVAVGATFGEVQAARLRISSIIAFEPIVTQVEIILVPSVYRGRNAKRP